MYYELFSKSLFDEELGKYESYGIRCDGIFEVNDVSLNFNSIKNFVKELNDNHVDLKHVKYLIEDFICEEEYYDKSTKKNKM